MSNLPILLPAPRQMTVGGGTLALRERGLIVLDGPDASALLFSAKRLQAALAQQAGVHWEIVAGNAVPHDQIAATLSVVEGGTRHPQGYELTITPEGIHAVASTPAGVFYAVCTLIQLLGIRDQGSGDRGQEAGVSELQSPISNLQPPSPPHLRLARLPESRRDARHQPQSGADHANSAGIGRSAGILEDQPAPVVHRAHLRLSQPPRSVGRCVADDGRGDPGARRVLPRAFHRAGAEPEFLRPYDALAHARSVSAAGRCAGWLRYPLGALRLPAQPVPRRSRQHRAGAQHLRRAAAALQQPAVQHRRRRDDRPGPGAQQRGGREASARAVSTWISCSRSTAR